MTKNTIEKVQSWYNKKSISDLDKFLLKVENRFFIVKCDDKNVYCHYLHDKYNAYFYSEDEIDLVFKTEKDEVCYTFSGINNTNYFSINHGKRYCSSKFDKNRLFLLLKTSGISEDVSNGISSILYHISNNLALIKN